MDNFLQNPFWNMLISAFIGGIIGLLISRVFDKPLERWQRKTGYVIREIISRFRRANEIGYGYDRFRIGKWRADWVTVEGSSSDPYTPANVVCQLDPTPVVLPQDLQDKKIQIEQVQSGLEKAGRPREYFNGPTVSLAGIGRGQIGYTEEPFLVLRFFPSDFYNYLATTASVEEIVLSEQGRPTKVRDKYLQNLNYELPIPEFVNAFAINLMMITSDGFLVLSKRGEKGLFPYSSHISPAINECVNPVLDRNASGTLSLLATAQRGASQELNIDISEDELVFFTLGVDISLYSYLLTGLVCSKRYTRDDLRARRSIGSKERWETEELFFLPHNLESIARFMRDRSGTEKWSPVSIVCLTQTLIHEFGLKMTELALNKYPPSISLA